jgi:hypothetical protein
MTHIIRSEGREIIDSRGNPTVEAEMDEDNARQGFLDTEQYERLLDELPLPLKALLRAGTIPAPEKENCGKRDGTKLTLMPARFAFLQARPRARNRGRFRSTAIWNDG